MKWTSVAVFVGLTLASPSADAQQTVNPHGTFRSNIDCIACHNGDSWVPAKTQMDFRHNSATAFALEGQHAAADCQSCHLRLRFTEPRVANGECGSCHLDVHRGNLGVVCATCHNTTIFAEVAGVAIHTQTNFPLLGAHLQVTCESCHLDDRGGAYTAIDGDCFSCHSDSYASATAVDHVAAGFSVVCDDCHNIVAWAGGTAFDHVTASNGFTLLGAHAALRCASCHVGPGGALRYPVTVETDCIGCHEQDYQRQHGGQGFPTDCLSCHTTSNWDAGAADHDAAFFPIFSGKHRNKWDQCATCHIVPTDFRVFSCFNCHEHRQAAMDDKHKNEPGYTYDSNNCLSCHPSGRKE